MNNKELEHLVRRDRKTNKYFHGCLAADQLPHRVTWTRPFGIIINTGTAASGGQHWVALWCARRGVTYFDSLGGLPETESIVNFLRRNFSTVTFCTAQIQDNFSALCGLYCAFFLFRMSRGSSLATFVSIFLSNHLYMNDAILLNRFYRLNKLL